ncbi:MAG TPA: hypothetical protein VMJ10_35665 [Kofleriaceae bacterium]|nr:hypothetical protein [Kofleriaceae bacterium]
MAARWIWLAVAVVACRDREAPAPKPAEPGVVAPVASSPPPGARPELTVEVDAGPPPANAAEAFAAEPVDVAWKSTTEATLRTRLAHLHGGPPQLDCRHATCLVTVTASEHDARAAVDDLGALRSIAQAMMLTAPEQAADGKLTLRAYVRFERPAEN